MGMITETRVRVSNPEKNTTKIMANVDVTFGNAFVVHSLAIIDGKNGLFVAMPGRKIKKNNTRIDIAHPITPDFRNEIQAICIEAYNEVAALGADIDYTKAYSKTY